MTAATQEMSGVAEVKGAAMEASASDKEIPACAACLQLSLITRQRNAKR